MKALRRAILAVLPFALVDRRRRRLVAHLRTVDKHEKELLSLAELESRTAGSWAETKAKAGYYSAETLNRFRDARSESLPSGPDVLQGNLLSLVVSKLGIPDVKITDFGGACGHLGRGLLSTYPGAEYTVVETARMVETMRRRYPAGHLRFDEHMPDACDIFYSSGTLQYVDDPIGVWRAGLASARHAAVLLRTHLFDRETFDVQFSTLFENGEGPIPPGFADEVISYPRRTVREVDLIAAAHKLGFSCISAMGAKSDEMPYDKQMVFWRD